MALSTTSKASSHSASLSVSLTTRTGIAYQLTSLDPLTNATQCALDATAMADLGANAIRVYHVDSSGDHDACMTAFASRGIYLFLDLDTFDTQFDQASHGRHHIL